VSSGERRVTSECKACSWDRNEEGGVRLHRVVLCQRHDMTKRVVDEQRVCTRMLWNTIYGSRLSRYVLLIEGLAVAWVNTLLIRCLLGRFWLNQTTIRLCVRITTDWHKGRLAPSSDSKGEGQFRLAFMNDLDIVAVRIKHPCRIIARIVFGPSLR